MERSQRLQKAQDFTWRNARLIERYLFTCLFANGSKEPVLAALRAYQNEDGGFGNALEPDKRCPSSQPQDIEIALHILDAIDAMNDPMVVRACDYLVTITTPEGGVPYALPSVNAYPHAPWWTVEENPPASLNPTAAIAGLLFKYGIQHPWIETPLVSRSRALSNSIRMQRATYKSRWTGHQRPGASVAAYSTTKR